MSVSTEINKKVYACDGVTTVFSFPYKIFAQGDIEVWLRDTAGTLTKLARPAQYTVAAVNNDYSNGATVTTVETYASGNTLAIVRVLPKTQGADYVENDNFPAEGHESVADRGVMLSQQIAELLSRAIVAPVDEEDLDMTIPPKADRKGKWLFFEADNGEPRAGLLVSGEVAVSAFMETVLDDADAAEARATLGAGNQKGYMAISLSNYNADTESEIIGELEVNGTIVTFAVLTAITGWAGIGNSTLCYVKITSAGVVSFTDTTPAWSTTKHGWYSGNDRYAAQLYKDGSGNYSYKSIYGDISAGGNLLAEVGDLVPSAVKDKPGRIWANGATISDTTNPEYARLVYLLKKEAAADGAHPYYHADADKAVLPNLKGAAIRGIDTAANRDKDGVRKSGNYQADKVLNHTHVTDIGAHEHELQAYTQVGGSRSMDDVTTGTFNEDYGTPEANKYVSAKAVSVDIGEKTSANPGAGGDTENIMKNVAQYVLIKY